MVEIAGASARDKHAKPFVVGKVPAENVMHDLGQITRRHDPGAMPLILGISPRIWIGFVLLQHLVHLGLTLVRSVRRHRRLSGWAG